MIAVCAWYCGLLESAVWPSTTKGWLNNIPWNFILNDNSRKILYMYQNTYPMYVCVYFDCFSNFSLTFNSISQLVPQKGSLL